MSDLVPWLRAQLDEDEQAATPRAVIHSGGEPAPVVPNCLGPDERGCREGWKIDPKVVPREQWAALEREHELSHATAEQRFTLADVAAKRRIVDYFGRRYQNYDPDAAVLLGLLAEPYADRPGYDETWRP